MEPPLASPAVVINGRLLSPADLAALRKTYGVDATPGSWWYDAASGLFGPVGRSSVGFMLPGHDFGPLDPACSAGATGVFVNGRHIANDEYVYLSTLAGAPVHPGRYWLDAQGNVGFEGLQVPVGNLYVAAQMRAAHAQGRGGGDNFWSTRFSAGNSTSDGSAGYVSLPGGGFATWGM